MTEEKSFICEHNAMRRKCVHCELDEVYADLNAKTAENLSLITTIESLQAENKRLDIAAHIDVSLGNTVCEMQATLESQKEEIEKLQTERNEWEERAESALALLEVMMLKKTTAH